MAYAPTNWQDNVTDVNAANLNNLEGGVVANESDITALDLRVDDLEGNPVVPPVVNGQWIKGVGGAMVWSDIAISDVTNLQSSLDAKLDDSQAGAANGIATLDSAGRVAQSHTIDKLRSVGEVEGNVPVVRSGVTVWEEPQAGGADLNYLGDYTPGTYNDGDIVLYEGVLYMCVDEGVDTPPENWGV